jgi:hypothetical protein
MRPPVKLETNAERLTERLHGLEREAVRAAEAFDAFVKESEELEKNQKEEAEKLETLQSGESRTAFANFRGTRKASGVRRIAADPRGRAIEDAKPSRHFA